MTTTDRICAFLESKLPHSLWRFHGDSIRSFVEKEVSLKSPVSPLSETVELSETPPSSETPAEHAWHDGGNPPMNNRDVMGEWADGLAVCWCGMANGAWYKCPSRRFGPPPIRWRELTDAEKESTHG